MKSSRLTSRDRVNRALERRDHDRVPRNENVWRETMERWKGEGLAGDEEFAERLCDDFAGLCWSWPVPFPDRHELLEETAETQVIRGSMGKVERHWKHRSGTPEHATRLCG